ncbi:MAG: NrfD/PsrC family molybdoenzyme membrane anchor subunit [Chloroflexota bacterium]
MNSTLRTWIKDGLWAIVFAGLVAALIRFTRGLGAGTGLNDSTPWGLWIAFKLGFVALAGGGFTLAAVVYIFHLENYRPILRRAILMAMLGYSSFVISLIFDLGLPWHMYRIVNWQHHSVMFEIAWCVILYLSVLILEFSPAILEHPWFGKPIFKTILHWLHKLTPPLVIAGIVLSTLHQSSLGSLFLIMVHRVHPLWYSPWLPYLFFTSAISAGLMALVMEGFIIERWFRRGMYFGLLTTLGKWVTIPLALYLILRLSDLFLRGILPGALDGSWQSILFLAEICVGGLIPLGLLAFRKTRESREGLLTSAALVITGIVSQRMSLSMFTMFQPAGMHYFPSMAETLIAFAIPAAAILVYLFFVENLAVVEGQAQSPMINVPVIPEPLVFASHHTPGRTMFARRSGLATFVIALILPTMLPFQSVSSSQPVNAVQRARGWETLLVNGNRSTDLVSFPHLEHQQRLTQELGSEEGACQTCHHLNKPEDEATACSECHTDYYEPRSIFDHTQHQQVLGANSSCAECHTQDHTKLSAQICQDCHETMTACEGQLSFGSLAPSYLDTMHGQCLGCHKQEAVKQERPELALCSTCHLIAQDELELTIVNQP